MKTQTKELSIAWQVCLMVMLTVAVVILPDAAFATGADTPMGEVLCKVKDWFTGNTGKGLATIAITIIGIGALLGKVSWGMAMIVGIGVAIVFGAAAIVGAMASSNTQGATGTCTT
jgi:type IV secretion system protein VirB2